MPTEHSAVRIWHFDPAQHDRSDFDCGVRRLNSYLKLGAKRRQKDGLTRVHVIVEEESSWILGYHPSNLGMMNVNQLKH